MDSSAVQPEQVNMYTINLPWNAVGQIRLAEKRYEKDNNQYLTSSQSIHCKVDGKGERVQFFAI